MDAVGDDVDDGFVVDGPVFEGGARGLHVGEVAGDRRPHLGEGQEAVRLELV